MKCKCMNFIELELKYSNFLNVSRGDEIIAGYFKLQKKCTSKTKMYIKNVQNVHQKCTSKTLC